MSILSKSGNEIEEKIGIDAAGEEGRREEGVRVSGAAAAGGRDAAADCGGGAAAAGGDGLCGDDDSCGGEGGGGGGADGVCDLRVEEGDRLGAAGCGAVWGGVSGSCWRRRGR